MSTSYHHYMATDDDHRAVKVRADQSGGIHVEWPGGLTVSTRPSETVGAAWHRLADQVAAHCGLHRRDLDDLAVRVFAQQEDLDPSLLPVLRRLVAYVDSVRHDPYSDDVVAELRELDQ